VFVFHLVKSLIHSLERKCRNLMENPPILLYVFITNSYLQEVTRWRQLQRLRNCHRDQNCPNALFNVDNKGRSIDKKEEVTDTCSIAHSCYYSVSTFETGLYRLKIP